MDKTMPNCRKPLWNQCQLYLICTCMGINQIALKIMVPSMDIDCFHMKDTMEYLLQSYSSNKRDITAQLMRRFIYECSCYNKTLPDDQFKENFSDLLNRFSSEIHRHEIYNCRPPRSCNDLDTQSFELPSVSKKLYCHLLIIKISKPYILCFSILYLILK